MLLIRSLSPALRSGEGWVWQRDANYLSAGAGSLTGNARMSAGRPNAGTEKENVAFERRYCCNIRLHGL
jgi:hypothetical protein